MADRAGSTVPNTPLLNRYATVDDGYETRLPSGRCNFTNLSVGGNAPTCGCKRFWDKTKGGFDGMGSAGSGFCMCEHHACFHDDVPEGQTPRISIEAARPQGNSLLSTIPNTPQIQAPPAETRKQAGLGGPTDTSLPDTLHWSRHIQSGSPFGLPAIPSQCLLPSETGSTTSGSQSRYMRPFRGLGMGTLDHIQMPRNAGSAPKPSEPEKPKENPRMQRVKDAHGNSFLQSLTEVATPSPNPSQEPVAAEEYNENIAHVQGALKTLAGSVSQSSDTALALKTMTKEDMDSPVYIKQSASSNVKDFCSISSENQDPKLIPRLRTLVSHLAEYPTTIRNHERRLDVLENTSYCNAAVEDLQDADNRLDDRVGDLEERLTELEKAQAALNDASSVGSRQLTTSFSSKMSDSSSTVAATVISVSRIETLEAEVAELQATAMPTYSRPWEVEVVFLPYGARLQGIWSQPYPASQPSRFNSTPAEDWTQTQNNSMAAAQARLTACDQTAWERSASELSHPEDGTWLMAKACGARSRVDERLRSRGLVKVAKIRGPDARDVQAAIMTAFGDLPDVLTADPYTERGDENAGTIPQSLRPYIGLQASWVPLRKLHKDSCLRFLNPAEMITPSLWTVPFLSSSVAMRHSGLRRLYVTQRDSYIQHLSSEPADWTWRKLRQLPRVYPDRPESHQTPEADAHEPCWEFDERLDPHNSSVHSSSIHSSFASHISSLSIRSPPPEAQQPFEEPASPSDHFSSAAVSPNGSTTPTSIAPTTGPPTSPLKERNPFRPIHVRTSSMPQLVPAKSSQSSKRRITSFEASPTRAPAPINTNLKRRRISRSPSRPRDTPRWSVGPPSPYMNEEIQRDIGKRDRPTTPFAYATPHSNAPYIERAGGEIGIYEDEDEDGGMNDEGEEGYDYEGYDANALSDFVDETENLGEAEERQLDESWEGVESGFDERNHSDSHSHPENGNNADIAIHEDEGEEGEDEEGSVVSSVPSEYPSTQRGIVNSKVGLGLGLGIRAGVGVGVGVREVGVGDGRAGFRIHVDEEGSDEDGDDELR